MDFKSHFPAKEAGATMQLGENVKNNKLHGAGSFLKKIIVFICHNNTML
jgi:hypothetical protein